MDPLLMEQKKKEFLQQLQVTPDQVQEIIQIPQRSEEWKKWRMGRLTASNFGAAAGHNPYSNKRQLLKNSLWNDFKGNLATEYGNKNEEVVAKIYEKFMNKFVKTPATPNALVESYYPGLIICEKLPWLAVSPDGLPLFQDSDSMAVRFLLEIKCPFKKELYAIIPHYYYDQIQGIMALLQLPFCDFVVWTPSMTQIRRYAFDPSYWQQVLFPRLETFYMEEYLPRLIMKQEGILKEGELEPALEVDLTKPTPKPRGTRKRKE